MNQSMRELSELELSDVSGGGTVSNVVAQTMFGANYSADAVINIILSVLKISADASETANNVAQPLANTVDKTTGL